DVSPYLSAFYNRKCIKNRSVFLWHLFHIHLEDDRPLRRLLPDIPAEIPQGFFCALRPDLHVRAHVADAAAHPMRHGVTAHCWPKAHALHDAEHTDTKGLFVHYIVLFPETAKCVRLIWSPA